MQSLQSSSPSFFRHFPAHLAPYPFVILPLSFPCPAFFLFILFFSFLCFFLTRASDAGGGGACCCDFGNCVKWLLPLPLLTSAKTLTVLCRDRARSRPWGRGGGRLWRVLARSCGEEVLHRGPAARMQTRATWARVWSPIKSPLRINCQGDSRRPARAARVLPKSSQSSTEAALSS